MTAVFLMGLTACAQSKNPEAPIEGRLEYNGTIAHQVLVIENGKKVDCAVAAANGVSLTCDWAGRTDTDQSAANAVTPRIPMGT